SPGRCACSWSCDLPSEIEAQPLPHLLVQVALEVLARARGGDASQAEHVDAIRHLHHAPHVVVDEQYAHSGARELLDPREHFPGEQRREADRGLVDEAQAWALQPRLRELHLLLLAAGEVARLR